MLKFLIRVSFLFSGVGTVVAERNTVSSTLIYMSVDAVVADVHLAVCIPSLKMLVTIIKDLGWLLAPNKVFCLLCPEVNLVIH